MCVLYTITFVQASSITAHLRPLIILAQRVEPIGIDTSTFTRSIFLLAVSGVYLETVDSVGRFFSVENILRSRCNAMKFDNFRYTGFYGCAN